MNKQIVVNAVAHTVRHMFAKIAILFTLLTFAHSATALEFDLIHPPGSDLAFIMVKGEIVRGDSIKFEQLTSGIKNIMVVLSGPGGLVSEALRIGTHIRLNNYATIVFPNTTCYSACALLWVSSTRRYIYKTSTIGFHAAWFEKAGVQYESGMTNAEIGSYLTHLGLRVEAIRFITQAAPNSVSLITSDVARKLGIDVFEGEGSDIKSPAARPTVDTLARLAALFAAATQNCAPLFNIDATGLHQAMANAITKGNETGGSQIFVELLERNIAALKSEMHKLNLPQFCLHVDAQLRQTGITIITVPSYDCAKAGDASEHAICGEPSLIAADRAIASMYRAALAKATNQGVLKSEQHEWLKMRANCRGDISCIKSAYDMRLQQMNFALAK